ncbi:MAG TPA: alpha/beta hydrolase [Leptospiraceae bacterium]|nr:alpha/beta hydrolase [Leptospiraceae bacterium]HMY67454.1 alpha/beta hydrolase [Leptospiraceae bacterium]HNF17420.1 alpha/beta hydrolase [Leptospiraceae bacterium]HNF24042.1 alpha/beta hydrolase [Leptospiraceae bacterium]HNH07501.1 alpha/beta hydrolase [Leptospiraceae bacterium]
MIEIISLIAFFAGTSILTAGYFYQKKMIFYPSKTDRNYRYGFGRPSEEIFFKRGSDELHSLHFPHPESEGFIVYFHGNAGDLAGWGNIEKDFRKFPLDLYILDYRGYGKSTGNIGSEKELISDCEAFYQEISSRHPYARKKIVYGRSIGTGPAVYTASRNPATHLILETPYSSLKSLINKIFPIVPSFLISFTLESDVWIQNVNAEILILHGTDDSVIPFSEGKQLSDSIRKKHDFIIIKKGDHNDLSMYKEYHTALEEFLKK